MRVNFGQLGDILSNSWDNAKDMLGDELLKLKSTVNTIWDIEHNTDGTHGDMSADSLSLQEARVGEIVELPYDSGRYTSVGGTWTVGSDDQIYLRYSRLGQLVFVEFSLYGTVIAAATPDELIIRVAELAPLRTKTEDSPSDTGTTHVVGSLFYQDNIVPANKGSGIVVASTQNIGGRAATYLSLLTYNFAQWPTTTNMVVKGSGVFPLNRNNVLDPF